MTVTCLHLPVNRMKNHVTIICKAHVKHPMSMYTNKTIMDYAIACMASLLFSFSFVVINSFHKSLAWLQIYDCSCIGINLSYGNDLPII